MPVLNSMRIQMMTAVRLALRGLRRDPWTGLVIACTLALGIGGSTTLFGLVSGAVRDLPVPRGHEVVRIDLVAPGTASSAAIEAADLVRWREDAATLAQLGTTRTLGAVLSVDGGHASRESAAAISPEILPLLHVQPAMGRFPGPGEPALVISWDLWQGRFEAAPDTVGLEVRLDSEARTIVGVMPPGFRFPFGQDLWIPESEGALAADAEIVARLIPGRSIEPAMAELQALWQAADPTRGADAAIARVRVQAFTGGRGEGGEAVAFAALSLIVLALLLVACVNGSTLLLLRAARRGRVVGVQRALGASRAQVGLQLMIEAALIALGGGAGGLGLTWLAVQWVDRVFSVHFGYYWMRMAIDGPLIASTGALVCGAAVVAGALPAWRAMTLDPADVLRRGGRGAGVGRAGGLLLTLQIGAATAALVGAALLGLGLGSWSSWADLLPERPLVLATLDLSGTRYASPEEAVQVRRRWLAEMAPAPAALGIGMLGYGEPRMEVEVDGQAVDDDAAAPRIPWNAVTAGFLEQFDVRVVAGRTLALTDTDASERVAVVNQSFASRFLAGRDPLRANVRVGDNEWAAIVGVVTDLDAAGKGTFSERVYLPLEQVDAPRTMVVAPARGDAAATVARMRDSLRRVDPDLPLEGLTTAADFFTWLTRVPRTIAIVGIGGAAAGLLTTLVGLFGLLSFDVRQRAFEIGVRMAVGADQRRVATTVLRRALWLIVPGIAVGLAVMYLLAPLFGLFLFGSNPRAPLPFVLVAASMVVVGLLAALAPAWRAARVQPASVLRAD